MSINRERLTQLVKEIRQEKRGEVASINLDPPIGPYHLAAAVLTRYHDKTLRPVGDPGNTSIEDVLRDSSLVPGDSAFPWTMATPVRRRALEYLSNRDALHNALAANPNRPSNTTQELFEAYVSGSAPALNEQSLVQLTSTYQVIEWLGGILTDLPAASEVRVRHELLSLLEPFNLLVGKNFFGREDELRNLREYVGVLDIGEAPDGPRRRTEGTSDLREKPALMIHGTGGVGKSSLLARFIWEHTSLPNAERFPWTYIDFDRPVIEANEPMTLLIESVRQLGIQYPQARASCDRLRTTWENKLESIRRARSGKGSKRSAGEMDQGHSTASDWLPCLSNVARLLGNLRVTSDPFLFVLDTFEEVQYQGDIVIGRLTEFLRMFQGAVPLLRIVISGRAPFSGSEIVPTRLFELADFDDRASMAMLVQYGVEPPEQARRVFDLFGGNPLTLRLAADVWHRDGPELLTLNVQKHLVQAQLYRRILSHIHTQVDRRVEKIAYPGLVLRRITPELIQHVLAETCGISVADAADAQHLFEQLRREVGLVIPEQDAIRHRPDVRRIMLPLLRDEMSQAAQKIEKAAVSYYSERDDLVSRAEEIYHRLALHQPIEKIAQRWNDELRIFLIGAPEELAPHERIWLKQQLGQSITMEERAQADQHSWEHEVERRARELIADGHYAEALKLLDERGIRLPGSALYLLEAQINERLGRRNAAHQLISAGLASVAHSDRRREAIALTLLDARLLLHEGSTKDAAEHLKTAEDLLGSGRDYAPLRLELALSYIRLASDGREGALTTRIADAVAAFWGLSDTQVIENTAMMGWSADALGREDDGILLRLVRLVGLNTERQTLLRTLGRALEGADRASGGELWQRTGLLPNKETPDLTALVLQMGERGELTALVTKLIEGRKLEQEVRDALIAILREPAEIAGLVAPSDSIFVGDITAASGIAIGHGSTAIINQYIPSVNTGNVSDSISSEFTIGSGATVIQNIFFGSYESLTALTLISSQLDTLRLILIELIPDRKTLAGILQERLATSIDALSLESEYKDVLGAVVARLNEERKITSLIAALRDSYPDAMELRAFAEELGMAPRTIGDRDLATQLERAKLQLHVSDWRHRLGRIETQICQIELPRGRCSGVLIGPDLVLTGAQAIRLHAKSTEDPSSVRVVFDVKQLDDGTTVSHGLAFPPVQGENWVVATDEKTYAVIRVADKPGLLPIGSLRAEHTARLRGWVDLEKATSLRLDPGVTRPPTTLLHFPSPLRAAVVIDTDRRRSRNEQAGSLIRRDGRIPYGHNTRPSSAGAPCFTLDWQLLAIDVGALRWGGLGIPALQIRAALEKSGLLTELLSQRPPT